MNRSNISWIKSPASPSLFYTSPFHECGVKYATPSCISLDDGICCRAVIIQPTTLAYIFAAILFTPKFQCLITESPLGPCLEVAGTLSTNRWAVPSRAWIVQLFRALSSCQPACTATWSSAFFAVVKGRVLLRRRCQRWQWLVSG